MLPCCHITRSARLTAVIAALVLSACREPPDGAEPDESIGRIVHGLTVDGVAAVGACSTGAVRGLSEQILDVINCARPGIYAAVPSRPNLSLGSAVFPFLETPARDQLVAALDAHPGTTMYATSMLRSVVAQYLLYYWYLHGECGVSLAATPGSSNHESGLALDVSNYNTWKLALDAHDFTWYGAGDEVHFTYSGLGAVDLRTDSVLAFQQLWNYNNPGDLLAEDGDYGPQTGARIGQSPQAGFVAVPPCLQQDAAVPVDALQPPVEDAAGPNTEAGDDGGVVVDGADAGEQVGGGGGCVVGGRRATSSVEGLALLLVVVAIWRRRRRSAF